jgi:allantoicase
VTHVRLDVFPDGGLARLRVNGEIEPETLRELGNRYRTSLPDVHQRGESAADL